MTDIKSPEQYRQNSVDVALQTEKTRTSKNRLGPFYWLAFTWYVLAIVLILYVPSVYDAFMRSWRRYEMLIVPIWIGWLCVATATCVIAGALLNVPLKYRLPGGFLALMGLVAVLLVGIRLIDSNPTDEWIFFPFAAMAYLIGCGCLWLYRWRLGWFLDATDSSGQVNQQRSFGVNQVSMRYVLVATTAVAMVISIVKFFLPNQPFVPSPDLLLVVLVGLTFLSTLVFVTIAALHVSMSKHTVGRRLAAAFLAAGVTILPFCTVLIINPMVGNSGSSNPDLFFAVYAFFCSYEVALTVVLMTFSFSGLSMFNKRHVESK
jgi:hypothetical protein